MRVTFWAGRRRFLAAFLAAAVLGLQPAGAQDRVNAAPAGPGGGPQNGNGLGNGFGNGLNLGNGNPAGGEGGAASADFDSLIDLIISTVAAESWQENGTGEGDIQPFDINGVYVDAAGAVRFREGGTREKLTSIRARGGTPRAVADLPEAPGGAKPQAANGLDARVASSVRYVSLPRLEAAIADCQRRHAPLDPAMLTLAGLQRVSYVLVYPETGDLVLAGPAGDWQPTPGGGLVSAETGRPVVRLDDVLALWRRQRNERAAAFGCSIVPREEALARTQEFLAASAAKPLEPGTRRAWLEQLRETVGVQDVVYSKIDPDSRIAGLLLAADYHMKLVGMGLAKGVPGVRSYLSTVRLDANGQPPAMTVLRWWFSIRASEIEASADRDAFAMPQRCVQVLSENEMLAARGQRVHTGQSEDLNRQFAESFTKEYAALADKYPVYGELERVFELALALALVEREGLTEKVGWTPGLLLDEQRLRLPKAPAPRSVETVINHRVIGGRQIIAGVSGGVWIDGGKSLAVTAVGAESAGAMASVRKVGTAPARDLAWWWD